LIDEELSKDRGIDSVSRQYQPSRGERRDGIPVRVEVRRGGGDEGESERGEKEET